MAPGAPLRRRRAEHGICTLAARLPTVLHVAKVPVRVGKPLAVACSDLRDTAQSILSSAAPARIIAGIRVGLTQKLALSATRRVRRSEHDLSDCSDQGPVRGKDLPSPCSPIAGSRRQGSKNAIRLQNAQHASPRAVGGTGCNPKSKLRLASSCLVRSGC
jgi:hypothetical protein